MVRLTQSGRFRMGENAPWRSFDADELVGTDPPGFLWRARIHVLPFLDVVGRDRFAGGKGSIDMRLAGIVPVTRASSPDVDSGALLRYLNEIIWAPAAALDPRITWEAVDGAAARATIAYAGMEASAVFSFDAEGRPIDMAARRFELARGREETWSTPLRAYGTFAGVWIPTAGAGVWRRERGDFPYIVLEITGLERWPA